MTNQETIIKIKSILEKHLSPSIIELHDESHLHEGHAGAQEGKGHFYLIISSKKLTGSRLAQHKQIYHLLDELMQTKIHALRIKIKTP